jgi:hypothetical protein
MVAFFLRKDLTRAPNYDITLLKREREEAVMQEELVRHPPVTKEDLSTGYLLIQSKCSCCKKCWIYLDGPLRGTCIYKGPYSGYEKQEEEKTETTVS